MSFLFNKGKEFLSSKAASYQDKFQDTVGNLQENVTKNIQPLDDIKSQAKNLTDGFDEKYNSAVDGIRNRVHFDAVLSGRDQLSLLSGKIEGLPVLNDENSASAKNTEKLSSNGPQIHGVNVAATTKRKAVKTVSVARAVSDVRHNVGREAIIPRGHKLRHSNIQTGTRQVGARVFINGGPTIEARDTSTPNLELQNGFRPVSKPVRSFSEADDRAFQILGNNLNLKNLHQTSKGIVTANGNVQDPQIRANDLGINAGMQYISGANHGLQQVLVGGNIGVPTEELSQFQDTAQSTYNMRNHLTRDGLIKRGQSFRASHVDPGLSQVGNKISGIFTIPYQPNSPLDIGTLQRNVVGNADSAILEDASGHVNGIISGSPHLEKVTKAENAIRSGYDMRNKLTKENLIKHGRSLKATHIDPGTAQISSMNPLQTLKDKQNKAYEELEIGKENLRQKGLGVLEAKTGIAEDKLQAGKQFLGGFGVFGGSSTTGKEKREKNADENQSGTNKTNVLSVTNPLQTLKDKQNKAFADIEARKENLRQKGLGALEAKTGIVGDKLQSGKQFLGGFGFFGGGSTTGKESKEKTSDMNQGGKAQTSMPIAMDPLQSLKDKQNKAFEDIEAGKENLRQKGLGALEAKTGIVGDKLQSGKQLLGGFGFFGGGSNSITGKENKEKKPEEKQNGKESITTSGHQKLNGLTSPNKKEGTEKKDENENDLLGKATDIGKGLFAANFSDTRGPSCTYTSGVIVRLALIVANALTIVRTVDVTNNHWNWGCAPMCSIFLALEYAMVVFKRLGREWSWWLPCVLVYLVTTLPLIWQLQLENAGMEGGVVKKSDVWTIIASDAIVYLTIFARWMLQGGTVTIMTLATVLLEFLANASDIMDLLSLTDQPEVRSNTNLMYWVLAAWSAAFLKFIPLIDDDAQGNAKPKTLPVCIQKSCGPDFTKLLEMLFSLVLLNGSFLAVRLYLLAVENVVTFSLVFFLVKNVLAFLVDIYKIVTLCRGLPCRKKKESE